MMVKLSLLLCGAALLYQSGFSYPANHSSSQPDFNQTHLSQLQQSQESLNQSDETLHHTNQTGLNNHGLNHSAHAQTKIHQLEDIVLQNSPYGLNQSLNQSDRVQSQQDQSEDTILQNSQTGLNNSLNQSSDQVQTEPHQWSNHSHQSLNQSDQVQTEFFQWSNQSHNAHETQHNQSQHGSFSVRKPTSEQDLHWLADCRILQPKVDLSFHGLTHLPATLFNSTCVNRIWYLDLSGNQLSSLDPDLLTLLTSLYALKVSHNKLTVFPGESLRDLISLQILDLSHNRLHSLPNYSLPTRLVNLDISFNRLTQLSEGVFHGLYNLQALNLSHNQLQDIHPRAFEARMPSVVWANFSYNKLTAFDGWPYIFSKYINADFRHNSISHFTNRMNLTVLSESYGSVDLGYNNLTRFPSTFLEIYLNGTPVDPMIFDSYFSLKIQHNPFICDCKLHWLVKLLIGNLLSYADEFADYMTCGAPRFLRGRNLDFLLRHKYLLVCEVQEGCPQGCRCMDTPHHGHVLVSCDANLHNYTILPAEMPAQGLIFLNLSGHSLRRLEAGPCDVSRLKVLDVNHNQVSYVSPSFLERAIHLEELNLCHNQLTSLPSGLQRLPVDKLHIAGNPLLCSCALAIFGTWAKTVAQNTSQKVTTSNYSDVYSMWQRADMGTDLLDFLSSEDDGSMRSLADLLTNNQSVVTSVTPDLLTANCSLPDDRRRKVALVDPSDWGMDCDSLHIYVHVLVWSVVMVLLLVVGMVVGWRRRYTLRALCNYVHFRAPVLPAPAEYETDNNGGRTGAREMTSETYHVYISVDEQNDIITTWVKQSLLPMLETDGRNSLLVYLPLRQEPLGVCLQENRADVISNSLKFLVVLSHGYSDNGQCRQELDFACVHHQQFSHKNIVIVIKDDLPGPLSPTQQTVHERSVHIGNNLHNNETDDQVGDDDHSDKDRPHNQDTVGASGDKDYDVPPRHTNRLGNMRDEANDKVQEIVVQVVVENHNVYRDETVSLNEDFTEHPVNITCSAMAEVDREITVTDPCDTPQDRTDSILRTEALPVGMHYPPPKKPATYIPMCPIRKDVHTERDLSTDTNRSNPGRSVNSRQGPTTEIPNHDRICACTLDAVDKPETEPKDITDVDDDGEFTNGADNSRERWRTRKLKRKDSKQHLLPLLEDENEEESSYQNRRQTSTHRERPEEQKTVHGQEQMNCYQQGQRKASRPELKRKGQRDMLERLSQFWEQGQPVAMEPLRSFLLQGRYLCVSDRFFKYKLLYQLSRK